MHLQIDMIQGEGVSITFGQTPNRNGQRSRLGQRFIHMSPVSSIFLWRRGSAPCVPRRDGIIPTAYPDRKSVVSGKSVSVRVGLGGRRIIKKKKSHNFIHADIIKFT